MLSLQQWCLILLASMHVKCETELCPTWKWFNYSSRRCECGYQESGYIRCSEDNGTLLARYDICISWDSILKEVVMGVCWYKAIDKKNVSNRVYSELPQNPHNLSTAQCGLNNREGLFCGRCKQGYAPTLHLLDSKCIDCSYCLQNNIITISLYLVAELLPLTLFYLIILFSRVNVISGPIFGYVLFCQIHIVVSRAFSNLIKLLLYSAGSFALHWNRDVLLPLAGIWNLNFFTMLLPHICYGCDMDNLTVILLEYVSILYIFLLLFISYLFYRLRVTNKIVSTRCYRLFGHYVSVCCRDVRFSVSIIHTLATFIGLVLAKVGYISCQILNLIHIKNVNGTVVKQVASFDPSFDSLHFQRIIAIVPLIILGVLPAIVLCLHPNRYFQNIVQHLFGPRRQLALAIFVDTWCSGYRDGLNGSTDYRRLCPLSLIVLLISLGIANTFDLKSESYFIITVPIMVLLSFCVSYIRPCKTKAMNMFLSFNILIIGLSALTLTLWLQDYLLDAHSLEIAFNVLLTLPHVVMLLWFIYNIEQRWNICRKYYMKMKQLPFGRREYLLRRLEF